MTCWLTSIADYPAITSSVTRGKTRIDFMSHILPVGTASKGRKRPHFEFTGKSAGAQIALRDLETRSISKPPISLIKKITQRYHSSSKIFLAMKFFSDKI
jgi:hypothetical protein